MPYKSKAQQGLFHSKNSPVSKKVVAEFDEASKGQKGLPEHVKQMRSKMKKGSHKGSGPMKKAHSGDCPISFA